MKVTFLGQAGLLFENGNTKVVVDPYFSDNVKNYEPKNYRRQPIDDTFLQLKPDIMVFTHNHLDHYDPVTVPYYINKESKVTVLSPKSVWDEVRTIGGNNNFVLFNRGTSWTYFDVELTAVKAEHSDPTPIGVIIDDGKRKYYVTGDTLYNEEIFKDIPKDIYAVFLPINGVGNNMNMADAKRFAERVNAKYVVPIHFGMFDEINPEDFKCDNKVIPKIYKEIVL